MNTFIKSTNQVRGQLRPLAKKWRWLRLYCCLSLPLLATRLIFESDTARLAEFIECI